MTEFLFHCYLNFCPYPFLGLICIVSSLEAMKKSFWNQEPLQDGKIESQSVPSGGGSCTPGSSPGTAQTRPGPTGTLQQLRLLPFPAAQLRPVQALHSQLQNQVPPSHYQQGKHALPSKPPLSAARPQIQRSVTEMLVSELSPRFGATGSTGTRQGHEDLPTQSLPQLQWETGQAAARAPGTGLSITPSAAAPLGIAPSAAAPCPAQQHRSASHPA